MKSVINHASKRFPTFIALLLITALSGQLLAQSDKSINVDVQINEDGQSTTTKKQITVPGNAVDLNQLMEEFGTSEDLQLEDGETLEITIKRKKNDATVKQFDFTFPGQPQLWEPPHHADLPRKALLGVYTRSIDPERDEISSNTPEQGAVITRIIENTAAESNGFVVGDIITKVDGQSIAGHGELAEKIGSYDAGSTVTIEYYTNGSLQQKDVELGEREDKHDPQHFQYKYFFGDPGNFGFQHFPPVPLPPGQHFYKHQEPAAKKDHAFLGIMNKAPEEGEANPKGVTIAKVFPNSTAEAMNLQEGDVIMAVNGNSVNSIFELKELLEKTEAGSEITIDYIRDGQSHTKTATVKGRQESQSIFDSFNPTGCLPPYKEIKMSIRMEDLDETDVQALNRKTGSNFKPTNDLEVRSIAISPNPGNGLFTVNAELAGEGDTNVKVLDINGREVYDLDLGPENIFRLQIDISKEPSGVYFLAIHKNGKQFNKKLLKQ